MLKPPNERRTLENPLERDGRRTVIATPRGSGMFPGWGVRI